MPPRRHRTRSASPSDAGRAAASPSDAHPPPRVTLDAHPTPRRRWMRIRLPVTAGRTSTSPVATGHESASQTDAGRANTPPRRHPLRACVRKPRSGRCIPLREGADLRASIVVGPGAKAPRDSLGPACSATPGSGHQGGFDQAAAEAEGILISCSCLLLR
jgi:hypothetical protein